MGKTYTFTVPAVPPSLNHYTGQRKGGGRYKKPAADAYGFLVLNEWAKKYHEQVKATAYSLDIVIQLRKGRKGRQPDLDGMAKLAIDALVQCGIIQDDVRVTKLAMEKRQGESDSTTYTILQLVP